MTARWIVTASGDLLNLGRVREVLLDSSEDEWQVVAYDSDPLHQENMWELFSSPSEDEAKQYMRLLEASLDALRPDGKEF